MGPAWVCDPDPEASMLHLSEHAQRPRPRRLHLPPPPRGRLVRGRLRDQPHLLGGGETRGLEGGVGAASQRGGAFFWRPSPQSAPDPGGVPEKRQFPHPTRSNPFFPTPEEPGTQADPDSGQVEGLPQNINSQRLQSVK